MPCRFCYICEQCTRPCHIIICRDDSVTTFCQADIDSDIYRLSGMCPLSGTEPKWNFNYSEDYEDDR